MARRSTLPFLAVLVVPMALGAQSFGDGPAFGGSRVFSEGYNPLGNSARFDQVPAGWYAAWEDGDAKARGFRTDSDALAQAVQAGDAAAAAAALLRLQETPSALRRTAYGLQYAATGGLRFAFGREELTGTLAGPALSAEARRAEVDRLVAGAGSGDGGSAYGFTFRLERVRVGTSLLALAPDAALGFGTTDRRAWSLTSDAGFTTELTQGLRFGLTATRLIPRHFWDVYERPQARAGFELDLGESARLSVEGDLNEAARLPMPQGQKTLSSSLRISASPTVTLRLGAERRTVEGGAAATLAGVSVRIATAPLVLGLGFQFGDDRPQRALAVRLGG
ncbi:MAG TPA: hypothetical protein VF804_08230 [Holophagaceae bacterium]